MLLVEGKLQRGRSRCRRYGKLGRFVAIGLEGYKNTLPLIVNIVLFVERMMVSDWILWVFL